MFVCRILSTATLAFMPSGEGTSLNQLVATAVAEKLAALGAEEYIRQRAERADDAAFEAALAAVPDVPPREGD